MSDAERADRKPSFIHIEGLNPLETNGVERTGGDPADFLALTAATSSINLQIGADGLTTITVGLRVQTDMLPMLDHVAPSPLGIPAVSLAREIRKILGARPLVRLVVRRDQLRLPQGVDVADSEPT